MWPWFLAAVVEVIVRPFGRTVMVRATSGAWGFERLYVIRGRGPAPLKPRAITEPMLATPGHMLQE